MIKKIFLLSCLSAIAIADQSVTDKEASEKPQKKPKSIFEEMEKITKKMQKAFENELEKFNSNFSNSITTSPQIEIKDEDNYVLVSIKTSNPDEKGVTVNAKKSQLKGELTTKDGHQVLFNIIDGKVISIKTQIKKEDKNENKTFASFSSSSYEKLLPTKVTNLEEATIELKDDTLILKLPKAESSWKKLEIK